MRIIFFEGPAGTGKTKNLIEALEKYLSENQLAEHQRVLALTFMHGSRKRLDERLRNVSNINFRFDCMTIDSFAWHIIKRWRSQAMYLSITISAEIDYDATCQAAAKLLGKDHIRRWVSQTYPIIIVDEMQDCRDGRLAMLQELSLELKLLAAADEFQDISFVGPNPAVEWLRKVGQTTSLMQNRRTNKKGLITAAINIRNGQLLSDGDGFKILTAYSHWNAVDYITKNIIWYKPTNLVMLSPTRIDRSHFVKNTLNNLNNPAKPKTKQAKQRKPYPFFIESSSNDQCENIIRNLKLESCNNSEICVDNLNISNEFFGMKALREWLDSQRKITGKTSFQKTLLIRQIDKITHQMKVYLPSSKRNRRFMTIHQAKNQEFENVIILWPLELKSNIEQQRRLLYNAITRAKKDALVIIHDPKKENRLGKPPFSP